MPEKDEAPLLIKALPDLASELEEDLRLDGEDQLADQVQELRMTALCGCPDEFCSSFYTGPRSEGAWGPGHENKVTSRGDIILDVVDGRIRFVELLFRDELRPKVRAVFGL